MYLLRYALVKGSFLLRSVNKYLSLFPYQAQGQLTFFFLKTQNEASSINKIKGHRSSSLSFTVGQVVSELLHITRLASA